MTIKEYFGSWSKVVDLQEADRIMYRLSKYDSSRLCPSLNNVFKAFRLCSFTDLRVVIIGQDPYPQKGVATGLAFANKNSTPPNDISPSLKILRESVINFTVPHEPITFDLDLEKWEKQGVLLLNSALSCEVGRVGSHYLLWKPFIQSLLTNLSLCSSGIVYVLMGTQAQSLESYINPQSNHILKCRHPSYYARTHTKMPSDIWIQINRILIGQNGYGINWYEKTL